MLVVCCRGDCAMTVHDGPQVDDMQALANCLGWRLEGAGSSSDPHQLTLRYGTLFRLRLSVSQHGQGAHCTEGLLELAPTGET